MEVNIEGAQLSECSGHKRTSHNSALSVRCVESLESATSTDLCRVSAERAASVDNALKAQTHLPATPTLDVARTDRPLSGTTAVISTALTLLPCARSVRRVCPSPSLVHPAWLYLHRVHADGRCPACIRCPFRFRLDPCSLYLQVYLASTWPRHGLRSGPLCQTVCTGSVDVCPVCVPGHSDF